VGRNSLGSQIVRNWSARSSSTTTECPGTYEPRTFVLETDDEGRVTEAFTPTSSSPSRILYLEVTFMKQPLVTRKNRKLRKLRERYPNVNAKLFYKRDVERLASAASGPGS
jgi:hypothetical protein